MALLRRHKKTTPPSEEAAPEAAPEPAPEERLTAYDAYGRAVSLTRDEYRARVLPATLRKNWDNPPGLYSSIVQGLRDDFAADMLDASNRLVEIDPDPERATTARGIVLMKTGDLDGAEEVLRRFHGQHDPSGVILTNLAKVAAERGEHERAQELLAEALHVDPNLENGLLWWAALAREQGGEEAYLAALAEIAEVPGSWRPQLWLARHRLDEGDLEGALDLYRGVLDLAADQSDALLMISGDLGNAGHVQEVFELVLPRYVPERHALSVGFNLLNASVQAGQRAEGEALLHRIGLLNAPHARDQVATFGRSLDQLKAGELGAAQPTEADAAPTIVDVPRPLWHTYLGRPDWLLPAVPRRAKVGILTLADAFGDEIIGGGPDPATTLPGLARSIPLALAEALLYTTDVEAMAIIPVVRGMGPVVPAEGWPGEDVVDLGRTEGAELDYIITGAVAQSDVATSVRLELWDVERGEAVDSLAKEGTAEDAGTALLDLGQQLVGRLVNEGRARALAEPAHYTVPAGAFLDGYLAASDELLALTLATEGLTDPQRLYGERDILNQLLNLSLADRQLLLPKLVFLAGLMLNRARGSSVYQEYRASALALADAERDPATDAFAVTTVAYHLYSREEAVEARRRQLVELGRQDAADWLSTFR
jgi:tetratricopeptide (TPR) repeat protein